MLEYKQDQLFYNSAFCAGSKDSLCLNNKTKGDLLAQKKIDVAVSKEKYQNALDLYNRELLYTFNMSLGVAALTMYVYYNQNVLPFIGKK